MQRSLAYVLTIRQKPLRCTFPPYCQPVQVFFFAKRNLCIYGFINQLEPAQRQVSQAMPCQRTNPIAYIKSKEPSLNSQSEFELVQVQQQQEALWFQKTTNLLKTADIYSKLSFGVIRDFSFSSSENYSD